MRLCPGPDDSTPAGAASKAWHWENMHQLNPRYVALSLLKSNAVHNLTGSFYSIYFRNLLFWNTLLPPHAYHHLENLWHSFSLLSCRPFCRLINFVFSCRILYFLSFLLYWIMSCYKLPHINNCPQMFIIRHVLTPWGSKHFSWYGQNNVDLMELLYRVLQIAMWLPVKNWSWQQSVYFCTAAMHSYGKRCMRSVSLRKQNRNHICWSIFRE